ncbi:MAG: amidohydrolase family protein [Planctomycetota bacterium]
MKSLFACVLLLGALVPELRAQGSEPLVAPHAVNGVEPGAKGGVGLAIVAKKIVLAEFNGRAVLDNGVILVKDGTIQAVGAQSDITIPAEYQILDAQDRWVMPGMVEMHNHVAGRFGLNDMVYLANPGLRASADVEPGNQLTRMGLASGVTSVLYIPGSGTNVGGQGVLLRTGFDTYERCEIRNPGSLKLAQAGNPERWLMRPGRTLMNYNTRNTFRRGIAYAKKWEAYEKDGGIKPRLNPQWEVFRHLRKREIHISTHTQMYQVVLKTITLVHDELGLPFFIDHGTFDTWRLAAEAEKREIFGVLGPRNVDPPTQSMINWAGSAPERMQGVAAGYQSQGFTRIGFNTDSPVIAQEELQLQASIGVRYGLDDTNMVALRGLTIVPAMAGGIGDRVGSIEVGKDADLIFAKGSVVDPRVPVELVLQLGEVVYNPQAEGRRW